MYHYFAASEIYNAIRIFIAAYVWMTGFGNFSYYYVRKDFSLARFAQVHFLWKFRSLKWLFLIALQINLLPVLRFFFFCSADDVAVEFLGAILLRRTQQQLHAILYLPNAHSFHSNGLWGTWYSQQVQWDWISHSCKNCCLLFGRYCNVGNSWNIWSGLEPIDFPFWLVSFQRFIIHLSCGSIVGYDDSNPIHYRRLHRSCKTRLASFAWMAFSFRPWSLYLDNRNDIRLLSSNCMFWWNYVVNKIIGIWRGKENLNIHSFLFLNGEVEMKVGVLFQWLNNWCLYF